MPLEALKVFCDLVEFRNFSKAAKANGLSQPTVTRTVQELETRLGGSLIDRSKRPLQLTELGQAYYDGCKRLLEQYIELEGSLRRGHEERAMTVRVAAIYSVGLGDMGQYIERFQARFPHARAQMEYLHPDQVYERVREGTADLGLLSFPARNRELAVLPWRDEEMIVVCSPSHPLARLKTVTPTRLDGEKYVAFDKGLVIRREVDRFLRQHGTAVDVQFEFDNIENIKKAIAIGAGIALLPEPTIRQELEAGTLRARPLAGGGLVRPLGIIHRRQTRLGQASLGLIDLLRENGTNGNGRSKTRAGERVGEPTPDLRAFARGRS
jgi:DNA-binding transcriptional LysR family regulator